MIIFVFKYRLTNSFFFQFGILAYFQAASRDRKIAEKKKHDEAARWKDKGNQNFAKEKAEARKKFPVSNNMFVLSGLFWLFIVAMVYTLVTYGIIYSRIKQESDLDGPCQHTFSHLKEENLKIVSHILH